MKLWQALNLEEEKVIALVGGGGKTSSLFLLGEELAKDGKKVVLATTAKMFEPDPGSIPLLLDGPGLLNQRVQEILKTEDLVLVGAGVEGGKLLGLSWERIQELAQLPGVDHVIVEADGSRNRPLKFPEYYEPVLGDEAAVVVVMGAKGLGRPLTEKNFHRPQLAEKYLGLRPGQIVSPNLAAQVICHPLSYGRFQIKAVLINQVETAEDMLLARQGAKELLAQGIKRVVLGAVQTKEPVRVVLVDEEECR